MYDINPKHTTRPTPAQRSTNDGGHLLLQASHATSPLCFVRCAPSRVWRRLTKKERNNSTPPLVAAAAMVEATGISFCQSWSLSRTMGPHRPLHVLPISTTHHLSWSAADQPTYDAQARWQHRAQLTGGKPWETRSTSPLQSHSRILCLPCRPPPIKQFAHAPSGSGRSWQPTCAHKPSKRKSRSKHFTSHSSLPPF